MNILVLRFGALGDVVLLTGLLRALRSRFPEASIDVVTKDEYAALLENHPSVTNVIALTRDHSLRGFATSLRRQRYDIRIDAHRNLRSRALKRLIGGRWHSVNKYRTQKILNVWTSLRADLPPVAEQYIGAVASLGVTPDNKGPDLHVEREDEQHARQFASGDYVLVAPGARHTTKRWPAAHWKKLVEQLTERGMQVVATGGRSRGRHTRAIAVNRRVRTTDPDRSGLGRGCKGRGRARLRHDACRDGGRNSCRCDLRPHRSNVRVCSVSRCIKDFECCTAMQAMFRFWRTALPSGPSPVHARAESLARC